MDIVAITLLTTAQLKLAHLQHRHLIGELDLPQTMTELGTILAALDEACGIVGTSDDEPATGTGG